MERDAFKEMDDIRISKEYHFGEEYQNEYQTLKYSYMMKSAVLMEFPSDKIRLFYTKQTELCIEPYL